LEGPQSARNPKHRVHTLYLQNFNLAWTKLVMKYSCISQWTQKITGNVLKKCNLIHCVQDLSTINDPLSYISNLEQVPIPCKFRTTQTPFQPLPNLKQLAYMNNDMCPNFVSLRSQSELLTPAATRTRRTTSRLPLTLLKAKETTVYYRTGTM
jgi:hypothetical protein